MRRLTVIFSILFISLILGGCESLSFSVDELLVAPSIADEQAAIRQALIESTGKSITLAYPRAGDYRSAFVITDIDADGNDEALVFYTPASANNAEQNVRVSVLDKDNDGEWHAMYELAGAGISIDRVIVADYGGTADIIIGYGTQAYDECKMSILRYTGGVLASIYDSTYNILERLDIDGCGDEEIVIIKKVGTLVTANVIKTADGLTYDPKERILSANAASIVGYKFGGLYGDVKAMFVDIADEKGSIVTEALYLNEQGLVCPTSDRPLLLETTKRPAGYSAMDYDGDGIIEIPVLSPFMGYANLENTVPEYMTLWLCYDPEFGVFRQEAGSYYIPSDGYVFKIPGRWMNFVTAVRNKETGEITFVKYDYSAETPSDMPKLLSLAAVPSLNIGTYKDNGYTAVKYSESVVYMAKSEAPSDEPLLLTADEISSNIYEIES